MRNERLYNHQPADLMMGVTEIVDTLTNRNGKRITVKASAGKERTCE